MTNQNVLLLEDDPERIRWFRQQCRGAARLDITADVQIAIRHMEAHEYDVIFLDHDLDYGVLLQGYMAEAVGTGADVARWMVAHDAQRQAIVIIHSLNPVGGDEIQRLLKAWHPIRIPFTVLRLVGQDVLPVLATTEEG